MVGICWVTTIITIVIVTGIILMITKVLFLTNSSAAPDSQLNLAKIRNYNISATYLPEKVLFKI